MDGLRFEWDEAKNLSNRRKHGVSFEEACAVFLDPLYVSVQARIEDGEPRWLTLGLADGVVLLAVAHTVREVHDQGTSARGHSYHFSSTSYSEREAAL